MHKSDNYVLQQVYQTAKKDPSVVVEDPAYAGGEAEEARVGNQNG